MKYWTVQNKKVVDIILQEGFYQPDFSKSRYLQRKIELKELYSFILESFNTINNVDLTGLIFSFYESNNQNLFEIPDVEAFYKLIRSKKNVIESLWNQLATEENVLLELDYKIDFLNPLFIDINDFQFLMPPISPVPPYTLDDYNRLLSNIQRGVAATSIFPGNIMQAHLPYIKKENLTAVYNVIPY